MKCAYLFSGQPIFYDDVLNYNTNYQISPTDKVCAHLWWDNDYVDKVYKFWFTDKYQEKNLDQKFIERYNVTDFLIEKHKNFDLTFSKKFNFEVWKGETIEHYNSGYSHRIVLFIESILFKLSGIFTNTKI